MRSLLTPHVITVSAEQRWEDVSSKIRARMPSHCVVLEKPRGNFVGVVRIKDVLSRPTNRIFADLVSEVPAITVTGKNGSMYIATVMGQRKIEDAIVLSKTGKYLGLVTRESLTAWMQQERSRLERELAMKLESCRHEMLRLEGELQEKSSLLDEAMSHLDEFSYTVSHDVRAPLRSVRGYAEALSEEYGAKLDKTGNEYLARIIRASHRLDVLVLGILSYSHISRTVVALGPTDLNLIVNEIVSEKLKTFPQASISVAEPLLAVHGNKALLKKCVVHLVENALKFACSEPCPVVKIWTESRETRVRFFVEDNGDNLNRVYHDRIFEVFQGAPSANEDDGVAIGLAIVRKAAEKMKGLIDPETLSEASGRFWIDFLAADFAAFPAAERETGLSSNAAKRARASIGLGVRPVRSKKTE